MKRRIADGSVELLHVRVGHRQAPLQKPRSAQLVGVSSFGRGKKLRNLPGAPRSCGLPHRLGYPGHRHPPEGFAYVAHDKLWVAGAHLPFRGHMCSEGEGDAWVPVEFGPLRSDC